MHSKIKLLIWVYVILLIVEGSLRKWILPGIADILLIVRDPVLLLIYFLAIKDGVFPTNNFVICLGGLAACSVLFSFLAGQSNLLVIAYGIRINYLHLPLIWVMGAVMNRRDVERIGTFVLLIAIPMTIVMVRQFQSGPFDWINRGVGDDAGGQIFGAEGRIRPPGFFAFITGPQLFYPLAAAFFFEQLGGHKRMPWYLLIVCGLAIAVALPVSISRTVMIATGLVGVAFVVTLPLSSSRLAGLVRPILVLTVLLAALSQLPIFKQGVDVFMSRWDQAAHEAVEAGEEGAWSSITDRTVRTFTNVTWFFDQATFFGEGIGVGSNVGSKLMYGQVGFALAEEEWGKIMLELGPLLGTAFILFRVWLSVHLGVEAWRALRYDRDALPLLLWSALMIAMVQGQWAPPTVLGFAVLGGGLIRAALNPVPETETEKALARSVAPAVPPAFAPSTHAELPAESDRRPPAVIRTVQK